jgi:hypothetical protein
VVDGKALSEKAIEAMAKDFENAKLLTAIGNDTTAKVEPNMPTDGRDSRNEMDYSV